MLVLKRKEGQWVEVTHRSGDVLRIRVCKIESGAPGHLNLAFDDEPRNFEIERPERRHDRAAAGPAPPEVAPQFDGESYLEGYLRTRRAERGRSVAHPFPSVEDSARAVANVEAALARGKITPAGLGLATPPRPVPQPEATEAAPPTLWGVPVVVPPDVPPVAVEVGSWSSLVTSRPLGTGYRFKSDGSDVSPETALCEGRIVCSKAAPGIVPLPMGLAHHAGEVLNAADPGDSVRLLPDPAPDPEFVRLADDVSRLIDHGQVAGLDGRALVDELARVMGEPAAILCTDGTRFESGPAVPRF